MGRWLYRVKQITPSNYQAGSDTTQARGKIEPTEPTKAPSVGFVGSVSGGTPKTISVHREMVRACNLSGLSVRELEDGLSDSDLADIRDGIVTAEVLAEYGMLFKDSGYFFKRDTSQQEPRDEKNKRQPIPPVNAESLSTCSAWPPRKQRARDQFIDHVMNCDYCYGPRDRYCEIGSKWRERFYWM